jgi:hypothetical protein
MQGDNQQTRNFAYHFSLGRPFVMFDDGTNKKTQFRLILAINFSS